MLSAMRLRMVGTLLALGLVGCAAAGDDAGSQTSTPSSPPDAQPPGTGSVLASARAPSGSPAAPACRPRVPAPNDPIESHTQTVRQTAGHGAAVEYTGLTDRNSNLWPVLPTLSEAGHVTAIAPTFTDGPHGPVY